MVRGAGGNEEIEVVGNQSDNENDKEAGNNDDGTHEKKKKIQKITFKETDGLRTLEKENNINLSSFDA